MEQYNVTGMSCAACSARVEKAVSQGAGRHGLLGEPADELDGRGGNRLAAGDHRSRAERGLRRVAQRARAKRDAEYLRCRRARWRTTRRRSCSADSSGRSGFLLVLMYFSMGHMMWGWPLPSFYDGQPCGHGSDAAAADGHHHGHQPEVLHQRLQGPDRTARRTWIRLWRSARQPPSATAPTPSSP